MQLPTRHDLPMRWRGGACLLFFGPAIISALHAAAAYPQLLLPRRSSLPQPTTAGLACGHAPWIGGQP